MIPEATNPTVSKKDRRNARYKMYVETNQACKTLLNPCPDEEIQKLLGDTMRFLSPPEDLEEITIPIDVLKQTALFAAATLSRYLHERSKS